MPAGMPFWQKVLEQLRSPIQKYMTTWIIITSLITGQTEEYLDPGHIEGAIQYTPSVDLAVDEALKTLPTDKTVVVYCYTGQNSARIAAYLRLLGYDAKSLKFGANGMIMVK